MMGIEMKYEWARRRRAQQARKAFGSGEERGGGYRAWGLGVEA